MKNVTVRIVSFIDVGTENEDKIEFVTEGVYYIQDGVRHLRYNEFEAADGMKGSVTDLTITDDEIIRTLEGAGQTEMRFQEKKRYESDYATEAGIIKLEVLTRNIENTISDEGEGNLLIEYDIAIKGVSSTSNRLSIEVY